MNTGCASSYKQFDTNTHLGYIAFNTSGKRAMTATITWTRTAARQMLRLPDQEARRVRQAVHGLRQWPQVPNVLALQGRKGYRMRVGRYRVLFRVEGGAAVLLIIEQVKKRDERTYD